MKVVSPTAGAPKLSISAIHPSPGCTLFWKIIPQSTSFVTPLSFGTSARPIELYTSAIMLDPSLSIKSTTSYGMGECGITPRLLPIYLYFPTSLTMKSTGYHMIIKRERTSLSPAPRTARKIVSAGRPVVYTGYIKSPTILVRI